MGAPRASLLESRCVGSRAGEEGRSYIRGGETQLGLPRSRQSFGAASGPCGSASWGGVACLHRKGGGAWWGRCLPPPGSLLGPVPSLLRPPPPCLPSPPHASSPPQFRQYKVVYRRYAGLFFSLCVDVSDNELAHLESIHLFVEVLDHFFSNVCELDLVFNFHKARAGGGRGGHI